MGILIFILAIFALSGAYTLWEHEEEIHSDPEEKKKYEDLADLYSIYKPTDITEVDQV